MVFGPFVTLATCIFWRSKNFEGLLKWNLDKRHPVYPPRKNNVFFETSLKKSPEVQKGRKYHFTNFGWVDLYKEFTTCIYESLSTKTATNKDAVFFGKDMDVCLNGGTPNLHPKMIIFSRKTHGCWVPAF